MGRKTVAHMRRNVGRLATRAAEAHASCGERRNVKITRSAPRYTWGSIHAETQHVPNQQASPNPCLSKTPKQMMVILTELRFEAVTVSGAGTVLSVFKCHDGNGGGRDYDPFS